MQAGITDVIMCFDGVATHSLLVQDERNVVHGRIARQVVYIWSHSRRHKCLNQQCLSVDTNSSRQSSSDLEQPEISMFTLSSDTDGDGDDAAGDDTSDMP